MGCVTCFSAQLSVAFFHIIIFARKVLKYVILCSAGPQGHNFADDTKRTCTSKKKFALLVFYGKEDQENHSVGHF